MFSRVFVHPKEHANGVSRLFLRSHVYSSRFRLFATAGTTAIARKRATGFGVSDSFCFTTNGTPERWESLRWLPSSITSQSIAESLPQRNRRHLTPSFFFTTR